MTSEAEIHLPRHIGIIMDGNGRWAQQRGLPRTAGHVKGAEVFQKITRYCEKIGVKAVTFYAFSTENWSRPGDEIQSIMNLFRKYLKDVFTFERETIRIRFIGERDALDDDIRKLMADIEETSKDNNGLFLNLAINYGGRDEIVHAARRLAEKTKSGDIAPKDIDEELFNSFTYTADSPPVDLILRPSGEQRISNFLLWQCAYSEFVFMDTLWPDFTPEKLMEAVKEYSGRKRRFGGI